MGAGPDPAAGPSPWSTRTAGAPCTATCDRTRGAWKSPKDFGSPRWASSGKSGAPATRRARICISRSSIIGERRGTRSWRSTRRRKPCACSSGWGWRNDRVRHKGPESPRPPPPARGRGRRRRRARGLGRHRARLAALAGRGRAALAGGGDLRRRSGGLSRSAAGPAVGVPGGGGDGGIRGPRLLPAAAVRPPAQPLGIDPRRRAKPARNPAGRLDHPAATREALSAHRAARRRSRQGRGSDVRHLARSPGRARRGRGALSQPERRHVDGNGAAAGGRPLPALARPLRAAAAQALTRGPARARRFAPRRAVAARASGDFGAPDRRHARVVDLAGPLGCVGAVVPRRLRRRLLGRVPVRGGLDGACGERGGRHRRSGPGRRHRSVPGRALGDAAGAISRDGGARRVRGPRVGRIRPGAIGRGIRADGGQLRVRREAGGAGSRGRGVRTRGGARPDAASRRLRALDLVDQGSAPVAPVAVLPDRRRPGDAPDGAGRGRRPFDQLAHRTPRDAAPGAPGPAEARSAATDGGGGLRPGARLTRLTRGPGARRRSAGPARRRVASGSDRAGAVLQRRGRGALPLSARSTGARGTARRPVAGRPDVAARQLLARDRGADRRLPASQAVRERRHLRAERHRSAARAASPGRHAALAGPALAQAGLQRQDRLVASRRLRSRRRRPLPGRTARGPRLGAAAAASASAGRAAGLAAAARDRRIPARAGEARSQAGLGALAHLGGAGRAARGGGETMMSRSGRPGGFDEMEALIYRLFAEKQFALALLALVMVAQLLSAQFLLLRLTPPPQQARAAPAASQRLDAKCDAAAARTLAGEAMSRAAARGKVVVMHLAAPEEAGLAQVTSSRPAELVVGLSAAAQPRGIGLPPAQFRRVPRRLAARRWKRRGALRARARWRARGGDGRAALRRSAAAAARREPERGAGRPPRPRPRCVAGGRGGPADHPQPRPARDRPIRTARSLWRHLRRGDGPPRGGKRIRADLLRRARGGAAMPMTVSPGRCRMKPLVPSFVAAGIALGAAGAQGVETIAVLELRSRANPVVAAELSDRVREAVRRALPQARVVDSEENADFVIGGRISRGGLGYRAWLELRDRSGDVLQRASATASSRSELAEAIDGAAVDLVRSRQEAGGPITIAPLPAVPAPAEPPEDALNLEADAGVLVAWDRARRIQAHGKGSPEDAAAAWRRVAQMRGQNPFREIALTRASQWEAYAAGRRALDAQLASDTARLRRVLPLASVTDSAKIDLLVRFAAAHGFDKVSPLVALLPSAELHARAELSLDCEVKEAHACVQLASAADEAKDPKAALDYLDRGCAGGAPGGRGHDGDRR